MDFTQPSANQGLSLGFLSHVSNTVKSNRIPSPKIADESLSFQIEPRSRDPSHPLPSFPLQLIKFYERESSFMKRLSKFFKGGASSSVVSKKGYMRILFITVRLFALVLLSASRIDQNLWSDHIAYHLIQFIVMKLQSTTKPLQSLDAGANPSKKLRGS